MQIWRIGEASRLQGAFPLRFVIKDGRGVLTDGSPLAADRPSTSHHQMGPQGDEAGGERVGNEDEFTQNDYLRALKQANTVRWNNLVG